MTIKQLNEIKAICQRIRELNYILKNVYDTRKSVNLAKCHYSKQKHLHSDPTAETLKTIEQLKAEREKLIIHLINFEEELIKLPDITIQAIIRWHYINGLTWRETAIKIYKYDKTADAISKRIYRYFNNGC